MEQQDQTKTYFGESVEEWQKNFDSQSTKYSTADHRNGAVLSVLESLPDAHTFLDVGCGTGQLVIAAAQRGMEATGVDFADEMISRCRLNAQEASVTAAFISTSIFEFEAPDESFDVISAQGLIEYLSLPQLDEFFELTARLLRPGGALVVGSRNRLFNLVSLNDFTQMEAKLGLLDTLASEAIALQTSSSQADAMDALSAHERLDAQPDSHPRTNIGVDVRYQFSPADLIARLRAHGLTPRTLIPIHFHGMPVSIKQTNPELHSSLAELVGRIAPDDQRLVPFCSTFVLHVRKDV